MQQVTGAGSIGTGASPATYQKECIFKKLAVGQLEGVNIDQLFTFKVNIQSKESPDIKVKVTWVRADNGERVEGLPVVRIRGDQVFVKPAARKKNPGELLRSSLVDRPRECLIEYSKKQRAKLFGRLRENTKNIDLVNKNSTIEITDERFF